MVILFIGFVGLLLLGLPIFLAMAGSPDAVVAGPPDAVPPTVIVVTDGERILDWRQLYDLPSLPEHLVVIAKDFLKCPEDEIKDIKPLLTMVGGKIVYDARPR